MDNSKVNDKSSIVNTHLSNFENSSVDSTQMNSISLPTEDTNVQSSNNGSLNNIALVHIPTSDSTDDSMLYSNCNNSNTPNDENVFNSVINFHTINERQCVDTATIFSDISMSISDSKNSLTDFFNDTEPAITAQLRKLNDYTRRINKVHSGLHYVFTRLRACRAELISKGYNIEGEEDPLEKIERLANEEFEKRRQEKLNEFYENRKKKADLSLEGCYEGHYNEEDEDDDEDDHSDHDDGKGKDPSNTKHTKDVTVSTTNNENTNVEYIDDVVDSSNHSDSNEVHLLSNKRKHSHGCLVNDVRSGPSLYEEEDEDCDCESDGSGDSIDSHNANCDKEIDVSDKIYSATVDLTQLSSQIQKKSNEIDEFGTITEKKHVDNNISNELTNRHTD